MAAEPPLPSCPKCRSEEFYRSRTRNRWEKAVKAATPLLYFRCRACGWRGPRLNVESWYSWRRRFFNLYAPVLVLVLLVWLLVNAAGDLPPIFKSRKRSGLLPPAGPPPAAAPRPA